MEGQYLHHWSFLYDGRIFYKRCLIDRVWADKDGVVKVAYSPVDRTDGYRGYVYEERIDTRPACGGNTKVIVTSRPDLDLAKDILRRHLVEQIETEEKVIESMMMQIERLPELTVGDGRIF